MDIVVWIVVAAVSILFAVMAVTPLAAESQPASRRQRRAMTVVSVPPSPTAPEDAPRAA